MTDCEKLKSLIAEIDNLIGHSVYTSTPAFQAWFSDAERFIIKKFRQDSFEHRKLKETKFRPGIWTDNSDLIKKMQRGINRNQIDFPILFRRDG